ncbi:Uncharacterised protein [Vibrio cholerae]|nr:Uncharacterised protein [Vibrio cholerae]
MLTLIQFWCHQILCIGKEILFFIELSDFGTLLTFDQYFHCAIRQFQQL